MDNEIILRMNEEGVLEPYEPYMVVECVTKEDYDRFVELVELGKAVVLCKDCGRYDLETQCCTFWPDGGYRAPDHYCAEGEGRG